MRTTRCHSGHAAASGSPPGREDYQLRAENQLGGEHLLPTRGPQNGVISWSSAPPPSIKAVGGQGNPVANGCSRRSTARSARTTYKLPTEPCEATTRTTELFITRDM